MVHLHFTVIPEGIPYKQEDVEYAFDFDALDDVLEFLVRLVARGKTSNNDMIVLIFSTLAERIVEGNRYGYHLISVGRYVPQIVEWLVEEAQSDSFDLDKTEMAN